MLCYHGNQGYSLKEVTKTVRCNNEKPVIFLGCALFWMEMLAHAALRVSSLVQFTILPLTALSLPPSLFSLQNGNTALAIARRLGYISVVDTLKVVTEEITTTTTVSCR